MSSPQSAAVSSVRSFALVGAIFYILGAVAFGFGFVSTLVSLILDPTPSGTAFRVLSILSSLIPGGLAIGFAVWAWLTYQQIERGRYAEARTASLVLGLVGLVFALLVGGIFFLLAYGKLGELLRPAPTPSGRICVNCGRPVDPEAAFCPHCGQELPA